MTIELNFVAQRATSSPRAKRTLPDTWPPIRRATSGNQCVFAAKSMAAKTIFSATKKPANVATVDGLAMDVARFDHKNPTLSIHVIRAEYRLAIDSVIRCAFL
jgi:hypothetical protein